MKYLAPLLLAVLLTACGGSTESSNPAQDLASKYKQFQSDEKANFEAFQTRVNTFKTNTKVNQKKPAIAPEGGKITLNFGDDLNVHQVMVNQFDDNTSLGAYNKNFGLQITLNEIAGLFEQPVDSFRTQYNDQGRLKHFNGLVDKHKAYTSELPYVVTLMPISDNAPTWYGETFKPGTFEAKMIVYGASPKDIIAIIDINATSSSTVSAGKFNDLGKAATADYMEKINEAISDALENNFTVTGKPSKIQ